MRLRWGAYSHALDVGAVARLSAASKLLALLLPRASAVAAPPASVDSASPPPPPPPSLALTIPGFDDEASAWALRRIDAWCGLTITMTMMMDGGEKAHGEEEEEVDESNNAAAWQRERAVGAAALAAVGRCDPPDLARLWGAAEFLQVELLKEVVEDVLVEGDALEVALEICEWHAVSTERLARLVARRVLGSGKAACVAGAPRGALAAALKQEMEERLVSACAWNTEML